MKKITTLVQIKKVKDINKKYPISITLGNYSLISFIKGEVPTISTLR